MIENLISNRYTSKREVFFWRGSLAILQSPASIAEVTLSQKESKKYLKLPNEKENFIRQFILSAQLFL